MNKTKSVIVLSLILVVVLFLGIFTFLPKVDFGYQTYNSPINLINKSQDLGSGYFSVMSLDKGKLTDEEYATAKDKMVESIKTRLSTYGIYDATISVADNQATIQVADTADVSTALSLVSQRGKFVFATVKAEELTDDKIITTSDGVKGATSKYYSGDNAYALSINFNEEGTKAMSKATKNAASSPVSVYFILDGVDVGNVSYNAKITDTLGLSTSSEQAANTWVALLNGGQYQFDVKLLSNGSVSSRLGNIELVLGIIAIVAVVLVIVALCIYYGVMGIAASLSLVCIIILQVLASAFIYFNQLSVGAILGAVVGLCLFVAMTIYTFEKIKGDYDGKKKVKVVVKSGFKKSLQFLLECHIVLLLCGVTLWLLSGGALQSFAIAFTYFTVLSTGATLGLNRWFIALLRPIVNENESKKFRLVKEVK